MGKKVNPLAMRPDFSQCLWFTSNKKKFANNINEDHQIRQLAIKKIGHMLYSNISIERIGDKVVNITIHTHKPGAIVGTRDKKIPIIDEYKKALKKHVFNESAFNVFISEITKPELNPIIVANNIAHQIELRGSVKSLMKRAVNTFIRYCPTGGIKISCSGRVGGAEIARSEKIQEGKMPLQTFKQNIKIGYSVAHTTYGTVSVKVLIYIPFDYIERKTFNNSYNNNYYEKRNNYTNNNNNNRKFQNKNNKNNNSENNTSTQNGGSNNNTTNQKGSNVEMKEE